MKKAAKIQFNGNKASLISQYALGYFQRPYSELPARLGFRLMEVKTSPESMVVVSSVSNGSQAEQVGIHLDVSLSDLVKSQSKHFMTSSFVWATFW